MENLDLLSLLESDKVWSWLQIPVEKLLRDDKIVIFGRLGELFVYYFETGDGLIIKLSPDPFDRVKDMMIINLKEEPGEVKTGSLWVNELCFTFKEDQLKKCQNVKHLYFVVVPHKEYPCSAAGWIYKVNPTFEYYKKKTDSDREMILIPMDQKAITPLHKLTPEMISLLQIYAVGER